MNNFNDVEFFHNLLDSFKAPVLVADTEHVIRYLNRAAKQTFDDGDKLIGRSLFDCHKGQSVIRIKEIVQRMKSEGLQELLIGDSEKQRIYMRAVRNPAGELIGYYERYEPPRGS